MLQRCARHGIGDYLFILSFCPWLDAGSHRSACGVTVAVSNDKEINEFIHTTNATGIGVHHPPRNQ